MKERLRNLKELKEKLETNINEPKITRLLDELIKEEQEYLEKKYLNKFEELKEDVETTFNNQKITQTIKDVITKELEDMEQELGNIEGIREELKLELENAEKQEDEEYIQEVREYAQTFEEEYIQNIKKRATNTHKLLGKTLTRLVENNTLKAAEKFLHVALKKNIDTDFSEEYERLRDSKNPRLAALYTLNVYTDQDKEHRELCLFDTYTRNPAREEIKKECMRTICELFENDEKEKMLEDINNWMRTTPKLKELAFQGFKKERL